MSFSAISRDAGMRCSNAAAMDAVGPMCSVFMSAPFEGVVGGTSILQRLRAGTFFPHHVAAAHSRGHLSVRTEDAQRERLGGRWVSLRVAGFHVASLFFLPFEVFANGFEKFAALRNGGIPWNQ